MMKRFSTPGRLSVSLFAAAVIALFCVFEGSVSAQSQPPKAQNPFEEELKPIPSGPGIQICEPVAPEGQEALADFGSGCGLWLQWAMGFHPELGQTPRWTDASRARKELHVPRLRLSLAQGNRLASILGVTHIAVGQISGTLEKCLLTYQLYAVPAEKAVGAPIKLAGTEAQIVAQLPEAARTLLAGLGVQKPHVPASVGASPTDLTLVGHYEGYADRQQTEAEQQQIDALEQKLPLATLLAFVHDSPGTTREKEAAAQRVVKQASGNFLMLGAVVTLFPKSSEEFARSVDSRIPAGDAARNAVLAYWTVARARTQPKIVEAAERVVRLAPRAVDAWQFLSRRYADQGQSVRQGRIYNALSAQEIGTLRGIYLRGFNTALQATKLDPDDVDAWLALVGAALFANDRARARDAFWKALSLDGHNPWIFEWGLDIYEPKWGGDHETLAKIAHLSVVADYSPDANFYGLGLELQSAGFAAEAKTCFDRAIAEKQKAVQQHPKDAALHAVLGSYLVDQKHPQAGESELMLATQLDPDLVLARHYLALLYTRHSRYAEAVVQMREQIRLTNDAAVKVTLAETLIHELHSEQWEEPEKLLREALQVQPDDYQTNEDLGFVLAHKGQYEAALKIYGIAAQRSPDNSVPHQEMGRVYRLQGKFEDAVREGEMAVALAPKSYDAFHELAESYTALGDNDTSVKTYQRAATALPTDAQVPFDLGKLYLKMGKKDEAHSALQHALELNPPPDLKQSIQELLDKNP